MPSRPRLALLFVLFSFLLPIVALVASKGVVPLMLAAALGGGLALLADGGRPAAPDPWLAAILAVLLTWCAIAATWSFRPESSILLALRVTGLIGAGLFLAALAAPLPVAARDGAARALAAGVAVVLAIIVVELAFGFPLFRVIKGPAEDAYQALSRLNRGLSALAILVWPVTCWLWRRGAGRWALLGPWGLLAFIAYLESSAATLGLACGAVLAGLALLHRRAGGVLLAAAVVVSLAAAPGTARLMKSAGWAEAEALGETARQRVHIWDFTAARILEKPLLGWGFDSARDMPNFGETGYRGAVRVIPLHPHNAPLQVLLELGAVGGALVLGLLLLLVVRLERQAEPARVCGQAMFLTTLAIAATAYGIWQNQWLALIASAAVAWMLTTPAREEAAASRPAAPPQA